MSRRRVVQVIPDKGAWKIKYVVISTVKSKAAAIKIAKELAESMRPSQVQIRKVNGRIQTEYTYGADPKRHKG